MSTPFSEITIGELFRLELVGRDTPENVVCLGTSTHRRVFHRGLDCYVALNLETDHFVTLDESHPCWPVANRGRWDLDAVEPAIGVVDHDR